jgi:RNA polymerase sigma-70 factor (ECF subfamily)
VNTDEPLPTRATLLDRLKEPGDDASWAEFHRTYRGLLVGVGRRAGLTELEAQEALQETLIAVAKKMPEFQYEPGRDSFKGWLLQIARWKIADQIRRRGCRRNPNVGGESLSVAERLAMAKESEEEAGETGPELADPHDDFQAIWNAEWERHVLEQALGRVKRQAKPEYYAIYHLCVVEERPIAEVCRILGVSASAVYLAKYRVGTLVKKELLRLRQCEHLPQK